MECSKDYDIVVEGCGNFPTRYQVNDACGMGGKANVHGSIFQVEGQDTVLMPGEKSSRSDIIALCREYLSPYKIPSEVVILDSMPRNSFGKIDKEALKLK